MNNGPIKGDLHLIKSEVVMNTEVAQSFRVNVEEIREALKEQFQSTSWWRSGKIAQYPDDDRNQDAVKCLDNLALTLGDIPEQTLLDLEHEYARRFDEEVHEYFEAMSEELISIGFYSFPIDAKAFCKALISRLR